MHDFIPRDLVHLTIGDLDKDPAQYSYYEYSDSEDDNEQEDMEINDAENEMNDNHLHENDTDESVESSIFNVGV